MSISEASLIARCRVKYLEASALEFDDLISEYADSICESPIERVLLAAIVALRRPDVYFCEDPQTEDMDRAGHFVFLQCPVGAYRADFVIFTIDGSESRCLIVECDGHDFHEKTKEQARRDKKRDRYMASLGFKIIRFAGSEIWADPNACATEVFKHADRPLWRRAALDEASLVVGGRAQ